MRVGMLFCAVLLIGCSSAPPERSFYFLRGADGTSGPGPTDNFVGLGRVAVPAYLDRAEIVVQTGPHEIRPARYHHWGEPLDDGVRHYLRRAIAKRLGHDIASDPIMRDVWDYRIDVKIETLHGELRGQVTIVGAFVVFRVEDGAVLATRRVVETVRQNRDGYAALVESHAELLDGLAGEIASVVEPIISGS